LLAFERHTDRAADSVLVLANPEDKPVTEQVQWRNGLMMDGNVLIDLLPPPEGNAQGGGELGLRAHHAAAAQRACAGTRRGHARRLLRLQARALIPTLQGPSRMPYANRFDIELQGVFETREKPTGAMAPSSTRCWSIALRPSADLASQAPPLPRAQGAARRGTSQPAKVGVLPATTCTSSTARAGLLGR
jgi:hypothetical protein